MDPSSFVAQLRAIEGDVEEVGAHDVRGVATTRYAAAYTRRGATAERPEAQGDALEQM